MASKRSHAKKNAKARALYKKKLANSEVAAPQPAPKPKRRAAAK